jgi:gliding motility-associated-like protein
MTVENLPVIIINPADTFLAPGTSVQLHTTVTGSISSFSWEPVLALQNPSELSPVTVPLMNDQSYRFTVESDKGCSAGKDVVVRIQVSLDMPNAFTPNGDGINDVFRIPAAAALTLKEFSVYDRWGRRIFYTTDVRKGWDGTANSNSQESPAGADVYVVKGSNDKGLVLKKGTVILVR